MLLIDFDIIKIEVIYLYQTIYIKALKYYIKSVYIFSHFLICVLEL